METSKESSGYFSQAKNLKNDFALDIFQSNNKQSNSFDGLDVKIANPMADGWGKSVKNFDFSGVSLHQVIEYEFFSLFAVL